VLHVLVPLLATATVADARSTRTQRVAAASEFAEQDGRPGPQDRDHAFASSVYGAFADACATIMIWRDAGWRDSPRPAGFARSTSSPAGAFARLRTCR
jgi:hypothetical protein